MGPNIFNNSQARAYALGGSVILATIVGISAFGQRNPRRNVFDVTPPPAVERATEKAQEARNKVKIKVKEVAEKAKLAAGEAEEVTDKNTSQDL